MTAQATARCDSCGASRDPSQLYCPYGIVLRCRDEQACRRHAAYGFDPTLIGMEDAPAPPPPSPAGTCCELCGESGNLYERKPGSGTWFCRDTAGCQQRSVEHQYLQAWSDTSPDQLITSADMRRLAPQPEVVSRSAEDLAATARQAEADWAHGFAAAARK